jgi:hypothetical protein
VFGEMQEEARCFTELFGLYLTEICRLDQMIGKHSSSLNETLMNLLVPIRLLRFLPKSNPDPQILALQTRHTNNPTIP